MNCSFKLLGLEVRTHATATASKRHGHIYL